MRSGDMLINEVPTILCATTPFESQTRQRGDDLGDQVKHDELFEKGERAGDSTTHWHAHHHN